MTRELARHIIDLIPAPDEKSSILDNACGNGVVAQELLIKYPNTSVNIACTDAAKPMVNLAKHSVQTSSTKATVSFDEMPGEKLGFPDDHFSHSITNQGITFFKDSEQGAREIQRTLQPGGMAVVSTWKQLPYIGLIQQAQKVVTPDAPPFSPPFSRDWMQATFLEKVLQGAGLKDVKVQEIQVHYAAKNFQGVCECLMMIFHVIFQSWSEEKKVEFQKQLEVLVEKVVVPVQRLVTGSVNGEKEDLVGIPCIALVAVATK